MTARARVRGIELRYLLTLYVYRFGVTTVAELVQMLDRKGSTPMGVPQRRCPMRCAGRFAEVGFIVLTGDVTVQASDCHAAPNTGCCDGSRRCCRS